MLLFCCSLLEQGCNIINPKEQTPTYIHIDSFIFQPNPLLVNISSSHYINSVFAYYNNNLIGEFDLPVTFPVITNGQGTLELSPSIPVDGRNDVLLDYPFYKIDTSTLTPQPGKIIHYTPSTSFFTSIKYTIISNFDYGLTNFSKWQGNISMINVSADSLRFQGGGSGAIYLNAVGDSSIDSTIFSYPIPLQNAFIEFDYKSSIPFYVGLQANLSSLVSSDPNFLSGISPSDHWQKFYLKVSEFAQQAQGTSYTFYIKAVLGSGQTSGRLLIDNIQLVTF